VDDLNRTTKDVIATKFHNTVAAVIEELVIRISTRTGLTRAALSGGTFQNLYLLKRTVARLARRGITTHLNGNVPCNDACISLGQAYLIRERLKNSG